MLYIVQFYAVQHTGAVWISKQMSLESRQALLRDEESDTLHKINYNIYKDTEYKYFGW